MRFDNEYQVNINCLGGSCMAVRLKARLNFGCDECFRMVLDI